MIDVSAGFRPPYWCPSRWAPTWRLYTNLYKFGKNVSPHIFLKKNCCDLNLGESLYISTFFLFPDSGLNLLNDFDFLFWSILNGVTLKSTNSRHFAANQTKETTISFGENRFCPIRNLSEVLWLHAFFRTSRLIDHFTVSCLVAGPLNKSEAGGDLVFLETCLFFSC